MHCNYNATGIISPPPQPRDREGLMTNKPVFSFGAIKPTVVALAAKKPAPKRRADERWGKAVIERGFTVLPSMLFWAQARLKLTPDADSDEAAQAFRFDGARYSDMMSPRAWSLAGW
jgi:hypothetical protein